MRLNIANDNYNVYMANNISMVQKMHHDHKVIFQLLRNVYVILSSQSEQVSFGSP